MPPPPILLFRRHHDGKKRRRFKKTIPPTFSPPIGTWAKAEQHRQYFLMLERAPGYFWVEFFVRECKRFMVEQNLILFYPWCYYATQKGLTIWHQNGDECIRFHPIFLVPFSFFLV
jgi:hypothetical protein